MKKLLIAISMLAVMSASASIRVDDKGKEKNREVSSSAQYQFANDFKAAKNVKWTVTESQLQKASFVLDGKRTSAFYDMGNEYVATTQYVEASEIPADAQKQLAKYYKDYTIGQVVKYLGSDPVYFVDLSDSKEEFLVCINKDSNISFFKRIK